MNEPLLFTFGPWKPVLTNLLLPPVPWLALIGLGAWRLWHRRRTGWWLVLPSILALWLGSTNGVASLLTRLADLEPTALAPERVEALAAEVRASPAARPKLAIVVLGGGRELLAPEYGTADLSADSISRLRYGLWLARATGAPVAFSGGWGWSQPPGESEAAIAARVARSEFGWPLRWVESTSRDTRGNARLTLPMLRADGIEQVLLVTHGWHMKRALRAFGDQAEGMTVEAAPMGLAEDDGLGVIAWLPSGRGQLRCRQVLREWLGVRLGS